MSATTLSKQMHYKSTGSQRKIVFLGKNMTYDSVYRSDETGASV